MSASVAAPESGDRIVLEGARDGHPLSITVHYAAIRELRALAKDRLEVASGFLVGELAEDRIVLARCAAERPEARTIGVFRTQPAGWPAVTEPDCKRMQAAMPAANAGLLLVVRTLAQRPWSAALFLVHPKRPAGGEPALIEFPADEYLLRNGWLTDLAPPAPPPTFSRPLAPPRRRRRWLALAAATLAVGGVAGAAYESQWRPWSRSSGDAAAADPQARIVPPIGLNAARSLDELELSWNRSSDLVRAATGATLVIRNGSVTRMVPVSADVLRGGRVMYHPLSGVDVDFRLELNLPGGRTEAESIKVLGFDTAPALNLPVAAMQRPKPRPAEESADRVEAPPPPAITTPSRSTEPLPLRRTTPTLTREVVEEMRRAKGPVTISVLVSIDATGKVDSAKIVGATGEPSPSGSEMRLAALNAAREWRFRPATAGGRPVPSSLTLSFRF